MADWHSRVWALSSVFYESIPANKSGKFFNHLQEMFEVYKPNDFLRDINIFSCISAIGFYCRILGQLDSYRKPEFDGSIRSIISTDYGKEKVYVAAREIEGITREIGYSLKTKIENYSFYEPKKEHAFLVSHAICYALEDILEHHKFINPTQQAAIEFYHGLIRFVIYSGTKDHKLVPSYVTTKLAKLLKLILSHPVALTLPDMDDLWGRECLNECAPDFTESQDTYINLSQDLSLAAVSIQDLLDQIQKQGLAIEVAQKKVAEDIATQARKSPIMKDKLVKWGQSLGDEIVSDVVIPI
ncbi:hypothetical protein [Leptolyngbya sp. CCY15150]|uniref:hypothetical protein n=1 Tax=Leptolyngbya sp. CCY15150 TaxID=2767772 RepID=UPI00195195F4|nr:hypothetical protein [Leptolyngbya sp. CCY15150]